MGRWWWKALKTYETWVYRNSDINFFISDDDLYHAVNLLKIDPAKSHSITYGIEIAGIPEDIASSKEIIRQRFDISSNEKIMLFNGTLSQLANLDALSVILDIINPGLTKDRLNYKIIICGKDLPASFNELTKYRKENIIYAGFVDDIDIYFKAADIFLNPITSGGGVKTKAIEAIGMNCTLISTEFGAIGLKKEVCGNKLKVVPDNDWNAFTTMIQTCMNERSNTPAAFYDYYHWKNIAKKAIHILNESPSPTS
jgi:glycosyltransferase involved in cell wall biosynthesis